MTDTTTATKAARQRKAADAFRLTELAAGARLTEQEERARFEDFYDITHDVFGGDPSITVLVAVRWGAPLNVMRELEKRFRASSVVAVVREEKRTDAEG
jgi:hypothetical protein